MASVFIASAIQEPEAIPPIVEEIPIIEVPLEVPTQDPTIEPTPEPTPEIIYPAEWTCFDFAMNWSEQHPEWGMVVISDNKRFQGMNHVVNYLINDDKSLQVKSYIMQNEKYDVIEYTIYGWEFDDYGRFDYYHFYLDGEIPTRKYKHLLSNEWVVFNAIQ